MNIHGKAYDFGVLSVILEIPLQNVSLSEFEEIAAIVSNSETLKEESRTHLNQTISALGSAIVGYNLSRFVEDYTVFFWRPWNRPWVQMMFFGSTMHPDSCTGNRRFSAAA